MNSVEMLGNETVWTRLRIYQRELISKRFQASLDYKCKLVRNLDQLDFLVDYIQPSRKINQLLRTYLHTYMLIGREYNNS